MFQPSNTAFRFVGPMRIPVDIDSSAIMLFGLLAVLNLSNGLFFAIASPLVLFGSIFLHELGHAWANKVQGLGVKRIMIYGGGGLCYGARMGTPRQQELVVASGPLVNIALWAIFGLLFYMLMRNISGQMSNAFLYTLMLIQMIASYNIALGIFNLLPVQPLDGGKLTHLFMLRLFPPAKAMRVTGVIGLIGCVLWIPAMIFLFLRTGWILFFIPNFKLHLAMAKGEVL